MSFPFDAVLILGKALRRDPERARRELAARAAASSAALRAGARRVLSLEALMRGQDEPGSAIVAALLAGLGVPAGRLIAAARSRSTREEALVALDLADAHGLRHLVAVTTGYHVPRARRVLEEVLGPERVSVHATTAFLALASPRERAMILAGEPGPGALHREARTERLLSAAEALVSPLPHALRWRLETATATGWRHAPGAPRA
ncbi:MAG: YdcF family protein [Pseudomonadota bacterium]